MRIIVGLGNPGVEYENTRHNVGVVLVEKLALRLASPYGWRRKKEAMVYESDEVVLIKPGSVFMNESGRMAKAIMYNSQFTIDNLWVVHDDLDIKLGEYKMQKGKGPKVHNGVLSVEQALGTKDFWRIRIGIENRQNQVSGEEYVLQRFSEEERKIIDNVLDAIAQAIITK